MESDMRSVNMRPYWKNLYCALLVALMGVPGLGITVQISWNGRVTAGFSTTFTCSSCSCLSNCIYSWSFRGRMVNGSTLTWTPDGLDDAVELQCTVLNPETGISTSATTVVQVNNHMSVRLTPPNTVPCLNQSLNLVCRDPASGDPKGSSELAWYRDGRKVTLRENMRLLENNQTLQFDSLLSSDAGFYQCESCLPTSRTKVFSQGYLLDFDPWNISISGPDTVFPGRMSQFTCLTSCTLNVDCTVRWPLKGGFPIGTYFSVHANELKWTPSIPGTFQNFTCIAENAAAGRSAEATKMVEVKGIPISGSGAIQLSRLFAVILSLGLWVLFIFIF